MSGNVSELCEDWYGDSYYASSPKKNPQGPDIGIYRVLRGGDWLSGMLTNNARRYEVGSAARSTSLGFRVCRD